MGQPKVVMGQQLLKPNASRFQCKLESNEDGNAYTRLKKDL